MAGKFVIVVDAQRDFMIADGALYVPDAQELIGPMNAWLAALDSAETAGVLLTFDTHDAESYASVRRGDPVSAPLRPQRSRLAVSDRRGCRPRGDPARHAGKGVFAMWDEPDLVICDARHPAQPPTPRDRFFAHLLRNGVCEVIVIGVAADFCVRWAVEGLLARGFRVTVPAEMTRGIARQIAAVAEDEWAGKAVRIA